MNHPDKVDVEVSQKKWFLSSSSIAELADCHHGVGYSDTFD